MKVRELNPEFHNTQNLVKGESVRILKTSRTPGSTNYQEAMNLVGTVCTVDYVSPDEGVFVISKDGKTGSVFRYNQVERIKK